MDPLSILFYAIICGALGYFAPSVQGHAARISFGVAVGVVAAVLLPFVRAIIGS